MFRDGAGSVPYVRQSLTNFAEPLSNVEQPALPTIRIVACMTDEIQMLAVELDGKDGLIVTFSDGTTGGYVIEELLKLRPVRERVNIKKKIPIRLK